MPRRPNPLQDLEKDELRNRLEELIGYPVRCHYDCKLLSSEIEGLTNKRISSSTIRRFFNIEFSKFNPSTFTIRTFREFIAKKEKKIGASGDFHDFILQFFSPLHFESIDILEPTTHIMFRRIAIELRNNEGLFLSLANQLAKNENGRKFYYELFPDYDILAKFQYKGYEKYLQYSHSVNDIVFSTCLLVLAANERKRKEEVEKYLENLWRYYGFETEMHPFVKGRLYNILLRFAPERKEEILISIKRQLKIEKPNRKIVFGLFPGFHYFVADALIDSVNVALLKEVLNEAHNKYARVKEFEWKGYYDHFHLFSAWADFLEGNKKKAIEKLQQVDDRKFYFISKSYFQRRKDQLRMEIEKSM